MFQGGLAALERIVIILPSPRTELKSLTDGGPGTHASLGVRFRKFRESLKDGRDVRNSLAQPLQRTNKLSQVSARCQPFHRRNADNASWVKYNAL